MIIDRYKYTYSDVMNISVGDLVGSAYALEAAYDRYSQDLLFVSIVGYKSMIDEIVRLFNNPNEAFTVRCKGSTMYKRKGSRYTVESSKNSNSDIVNAVICLKDYYKVQNHGEEWTMYFYLDEEEDTDSRIKELLLDKLVKYSSVPVLPEWIDYLYTVMEDDFVQCYHLYLEGTRKVYCCRLHGNQDYVKRLITEGLSNGSININGSNEPSVMLDESSGLNDYLSLFGSMLANKIQQKFKPKFIPGEDSYSNYLLTIDDYIHCKGVELYTAQMAVIQANANNFNVNKHGFIVGEMGSGIGRFQYLK